MAAITSSSFRNSCKTLMCARIDDRTVVMPAGEPHDAVAGALKARKFEVIRLPYDAVYCMGGSFRCCHQPFIRL